MSVVIKTTEMQYRDANGVYHGINAVAEKKIADQEAALDQIIAGAQDAVNQLETQKNTIAQTVASMAQLGTDTTLSTPGMAADAAACGDLKSALVNDMTSKFPNDFNVLSIWEQGGWGYITTAPVRVDNTTRIRAVATFHVANKMTITRALSGYDYIYGLYTSGGTLVYGSVDWLSVNLPISLTSGDYTLYIAIRKSDNANINPSELLNTGITVNIDDSFYGFPNSFWNTVAKKQNVDDLGTNLDIESGRNDREETNIVESEKIVGGIGSIKTLTKTSGLIFDGTKFVKANSTYDSIIFKVLKGQYITVKANNCTIQSIRAFAEEPVLNGVSSIDNISTSFTYYYAQDVKYIVCNFTLSGGDPSIDVLFSDTIDGIGSKETTGTMTNANLANILWDGTKYVSGNANYNSMLICMKKGEYISWSVTTGVQQAARIFTADPILNATAAKIEDLTINSYLCSVEKCYLLIQFNLTNVSTISVSYTKSAIRMWNSIEKGTPLYGKKIVCFGDSITEFVDNDTKKSYPDYLQSISLANVVNCGVGGTRMAQRTTPATAENPTPENGAQAYAALDLSNLIQAWINNSWTVVDAANNYLKVLAPDYDDNTIPISNLKNNPLSGVDIVTIMIGVNDIGGNTVIGEVNSSSNNEFCGAFNNIIESLIAAKSSIKIYVFSNTVKYYQNVFDDAHWSDNYENSLGVSLPELNEKLEQLSKRQHISFSDMYWSLGWNKQSYLHFLNPLMVDGYHPTYNEGFKVIAERIYGSLISKLE